MKKNFFKTLSLLLALLLLAGIFPVSSVASEGSDQSDPGEATAEMPVSSNPSDEVGSEEEGTSPDDLPGTPAADGILDPTGPDGGENAPAPGSQDGNSNGPDEENQKQPGESGFQSNSGDPVRLELKFDIVEKEDGEEQAEQGKEDKEETENAEKKYTLRTVNKVFPGNTYIYARNWETEETERYRSALSELRQTEASILKASFRDGRNEDFTFDTLVEFTLSCTDWKGKNWMS